MGFKEWWDKQPTWIKILLAIAIVLLIRPIIGVIIILLAPGFVIWLYNFLDEDYASAVFFVLELLIAAFIVSIPYIIGEIKWKLSVRRAIKEIEEEIKSEKEKRGARIVDYGKRQQNIDVMYP